jgi:transcriptional antiterminator NusG
MAKPSWYAVQTKPRHEKVVRDELTDKGVENYLPTYTESSKWRNRQTVSVERCVFPGYIFARTFGTPDEHYGILNTFGVTRFVSFCGEDAVIPDDEIAAIYSMIESGLVCQVHEPKVGDMARVMRGPLRDVEGVLARIKHELRFVLNVHWMGRAVSVEIDAADVELIKRAA